ncbi:MAG: RcnB family protein [Salinicola sp.]|uniref:RcnB family protein n=1 Tax=Salinicola sp. TaxID=1978524 RepID=UPI001DA9142A|nr:RcnB family protein [Salinicola sp.]NRB54593.1 RcnB family protein [Salinicola sp.]
MKHRVVTIGVLIAALGTAGIAQADPGHGHGHGKGHGPHGKGPHGHDHHDRHGGGHDGYRDHRGWHEGGHLADRYYRDDRYWVRDWHARHLREPPRGHRWLNIDGDYVLAAVATGVITAIVLNR